MARRLAAILAADVVGYSRLMEQDEAGTLAALKAHRSQFIDPLIANHGGRIVKLMGDGALVEFPSVVDAVACAVAVQQGMAARNAETPEDNRIVFRIGVNLGDVVIDGDDIYGDGVNVAARLETMAEPGGVCISGTVHEHIAGKLDQAFADAGEQTVKNIARPIRVWRWTEALSGPGPTSGSTDSLPSPDKASIAVLPFTNMSGDPEQEYFSDGITEDIITALSRFRSLLVIARNSSFTFKGQSVDMKEAGRKLGAAYVVEGSVRKAGNRVRVTAQLIDTESGGHVWADRYDRDLDDVFAIQDEIVEQVIWKVARQLEETEIARARRNQTTADTYDLYLLGTAYMYRFTPEDAAQAVEVLQQAIERDPQFSPAHMRLAGAYLGQAIGSNSIEREIECYEKGVASAKAALALNESDENAHAVLAQLFNLLHRRADARRHIDRAVELNPNGAFVVNIKAYDLLWSNRLEEAQEWISRAIRLDPAKPGYLFETMGLTAYLLGRFDEAAECFHSIPPAFHYQHADLAAALAQAGRMDEARHHVAEALRLWPGGTIETLLTDPWEPAARAQLVEGLRKAGFPD